MWRKAVLAVALVAIGAMVLVASSSNAAETGGGGR